MSVCVATFLAVKKCFIIAEPNQVLARFHLDVF